MRVHINLLIDGKAHAGIFRNHNHGMSTDWSKYSNPRETRNRAKHYGGDPNNYGIIGMNVGETRKIENQTVDHDPQPENRAHTNVNGEKTTEARLKLYRIFSWVISPEFHA